MKINKTAAAAAIADTQDVVWLRHFGEGLERAAKGMEDSDREIKNLRDMIAARCAELAKDALRAKIKSPIAGATFIDRFNYALAVYEDCLSLAKGKRTSAGRTRQMIKKLGEAETVRHIVASMTTSSGLATLVEFGRLDCSFEQLVIDFPSEFDAALSAKAEKNLNSIVPR
jgi:hypothetical protein